jgi:hypothetical protein
MPSQLFLPMMTAFEGSRPSPLVILAKYAISFDSRQGKVELRPMPCEGVAATMSVSESCRAQLLVSGQMRERQRAARTGFIASVIVVCEVNIAPQLTRRDERQSRGAHEGQA